MRGHLGLCQNLIHESLIQSLVLVNAVSEYPENTCSQVLGHLPLLSNTWLPSVVDKNIGIWKPYTLSHHTGMKCSCYYIHAWLCHLALG